MWKINITGTCYDPTSLPTLGGVNYKTLLFSELSTEGLKPSEVLQYLKQFPTPSRVVILLSSTRLNEGFKGGSHLHHIVRGALCGFQQDSYRGCKNLYMYLSNVIPHRLPTTMSLEPTKYVTYGTYATKSAIYPYIYIAIDNEAGPVVHISCAVCSLSYRCKSLSFQGMSESGGYYVDNRI